MTINIYETVLKVYTENKEDLIRTSTTESYVLYPDDGMLLKNTVTGYITNKSVGVNSKEQIKNYIEIEEA